MFEYVIEELITRGHKVTAITSFKPQRPLSNYTEVLIDPPYNVSESVSFKHLYERRDHNNIESLFNIWHIGLETSKHGLESANVQKFISENNAEFDVILAEQFFQESWLMFAHKYKAPIITLNTYGYSDNMDRIFGFYSPWAIVPHHLLPYKDGMRFKERHHNTFISLFDWLMRNIFYLPRQEAIAKQNFKAWKVNETHILPTVRQMEKKISVVLVNSHLAIDHPRPSMPNVVNVGGIHLRATKPLPDDLKKFVEGAKDGVIYFSFGTNIKTSDMPEAKRKIFIDTFAKLKQRVLWKWEDNSLKNISKNVMIRPWFPQHDLLAHPNVVLFITHGGLFSVQESIYNGVPMLVIPFYNDQFKNAEKAVREGYALTTRMSQVNDTAIGSYIGELLVDSSYRQRARETSEIFRDNIVPPMQTAIYWIEYVVRHPRAQQFLVSRAQNNKFLSFCLVDIFSFYFAGLALFIYLKILFFKWLAKKMTQQKIKNE